MEVFVDTSAIYTLMDRDDRYHERAAVTWQKLLHGSVRLLTTNYVILETSALVQHRLGMAAVRVLDDELAPVFEIEWVTEAHHQAGVAALLVARRRKLSLVDCVSFHVMRMLGIETAFCFDKHFREQGFQILPK